MTGVRLDQLLAAEPRPQTPQKDEVVHRAEVVGRILSGIKLAGNHTRSPSQQPLVPRGAAAELDSDLPADYLSCSSLTSCSDTLWIRPTSMLTMSRNRFQLIWWYLHFNDNTSQDATDRMYKVCPVLDHIVGKFKELYQPGQNICIDEGMMLWRGRLSFRVYNPQKPVKYGIKSYILCDSATGGEPKVINEVTKSDLGAGGKIVRHNGGVMVLAWHDKRLVKMVTTCHQDRMEKVNVWQKGHRTKVPQLKPECIVAYNSCMNGVDKLDQNIAYYPFIRRSLNWSKKCVAYLFQLSMFNAHVLYKARNPGECKSHLEFIRRVVRSWTAKRHVGAEEVGEQEEEGEDVAGVGTSRKAEAHKGPLITQTRRAS
ncbi:hypothetical protein AAFF_G00206840 [Aldrovandia affinis]|uniref:PiggyBac transposable element-derived protein domain-containing protein n=1 Tax=Aldrovandia affinis TaxID=143900 RepID=A0AAD7R0H9_9TELE|nr:hypothetical protein AAFF_G00206840 [Aldrovandia affinis]